MAPLPMLLKIQSVGVQCLFRCRPQQYKPTIAQGLFYEVLLHNLQHLNYHIIDSQTYQLMTQQMNLYAFQNNLNFNILPSSCPPLSSNLYNQQLPVQPKPVRLRKKKIYNPLIAKGKWTQKQQQAYISFLQNNSQFMQTSLQRKSKKVFLTMSQIIQTRDADQCRSHHQKMILYRSSVAEIIKYYRNEYSETEDVQPRKLKLFEKALGKTQNTNTCKQEVGQVFKLADKGNSLKIVVQSSRIKIYDF